MNEYNIIILGNPVDGFIYIGPFETHTEALSYAESRYRSSSWWIGTMTEPEKREGQ